MKGKLEEQRGARRIKGRLKGRREGWRGGWKVLGIIQGGLEGTGKAVYPV